MSSISSLLRFPLICFPFRLYTPPTRQPSSVIGHPPIGAIFQPPDRGEPKNFRHHAPNATEFSPHSIDRSRTAPPAPSRIERPCIAVDVGSAQSVSVDETTGLIGKRQHPAGFIARANPLRDSRSKPSGAIKQQNKAMIRSIRDTHEAIRLVRCRHGKFGARFRPRVINILLYCNKLRLQENHGLYARFCSANGRNTALSEKWRCPEIEHVQVSV